LYRPAEEQHSQKFGPQGASCFTVAIPLRIARRATADALFDAHRDYGQTSAALFMHEAQREHRRPDSTSELYVEGLLLELLAVAGRNANRGVPQPTVRRAQELIAAAPNAPLTFDAIACELDADPTLLARAFREQVGCSMAEYARRLRLASAVRMLTTSSQPISVIAAEYGFYDQSHFGRHCRRRFGLSPVALRRAGREGVVPIER
jgi:transcriptional regulator GlxA family with amidase domain